MTRRGSANVSLGILVRTVRWLSVRMTVFRGGSVLMDFASVDLSTLGLVVSIRHVLIIVTKKASAMMKVNVYVFLGILGRIALSKMLVQLLLNVFKNVQILA